MFARIISLPRLYAFAKRHSFVKKVGKIVWSYLSKIWTVVGHFGKPKTSYPPIKEYVVSSEEWAKESLNARAGVTFTQLHDAVDLRRKIPGTVEKSVHWKYEKKQAIEFPKTYLLSIPNGRVAMDGYVITPENQLLGDVSKVISQAKHIDVNETHPAINVNLPPARYYKGKVATISFPFAGTNYYHWMLDLLPRLFLIEQSGLSLGDLDFIYINDSISHFQRETLNFFGIDKAKIIESQWNPHIQAEQLIVPSLVGCTGDVPIWACEWLRAKFWPDALPKPHRRLYINRRKVSYRKVKNELEIEGLLKQYGFESIAPEKYSVLEQAKMFAEAEVVVAPHGAGLTNIVFCQAGAKVIELLHHSAVNEMYWTISNVSNIDYNYILSSGIRPENGVDMYENFVDFSFNIDEIKSMIEQLNLKMPIPN